MPRFGKSHQPDGQRFLIDKDAAAGHRRMAALVVTAPVGSDSNIGPLVSEPLSGKGNLVRWKGLSPHQTFKGRESSLKEHGHTDYAEDKYKGSNYPENFSELQGAGIAGRQGSLAYLPKVRIGHYPGNETDGAAHEK